MTVDVRTLRTHLDYTAWASARLLEAADKLTPEELTRDFGTADKSVVGSLAHVVAQIPQEQRVERPVDRRDRRLIAPSGSFQRDLETIRRHPRGIDTRRGKAKRLLASLTAARRAAPTTPRRR